MRKKLLLISLLSVSVSSAFAATITPQKGVSILYVNGQASETKVGPNTLNEGFNQVVVRMDKDMSRSKSADVFTSAPYVLTFDNDGSDVVVDHPIARSKIEAERVFAEGNPSWSLTQDGAELEFSQELLKGKSGFLPYSGMENLIAEHNKQRGIYFNNGELVDAPVAAELAPVAVATTSAVATANSTANNAAKATSQAPKAAVKNVEQLKAWYLKASKEERKEFRRWMIDQE